jgi:Fe/S biogenesis protein NfuA
MSPDSSATEAEARESDTATAVVPVIRLTEAAHARILELREGEAGAEGLGLRIEVTGSQGSDYTYDLSFAPAAEATDDEDVRDQDGLAVIVPVADIDKVQGATLDVPSLPGQGGLVLRNPNRPNPLGDLSALELTGELPEKVQQLLDGQINPALAMHGGSADLVGVEGQNVLIRMGGGCQGCSMSMLTLREGITAMIKEALPEVAEVVDVTDHEAGDNPFYT